MTIEELTKEFERWRNNRKADKEPIPEKLWESAVELAEKISPTIVAKSCKISTSKLKKKMGLKSSVPKIQFNKISSPSRIPQVELTTSSGVQIKIY